MIYTTKMKTFNSRILAALALAFNLTARAAAPDLLPQLETALKNSANYEFGKDSGPLVAAEQLAISSLSDPELRAKVERQLLEALSLATTRPARDFLCRLLFTVGTVRSVPQLEALLTDPEMSHPARMALARMAIPEADAALHRALSKTAGKIRAGLINSLGDRRYEPALNDLVKLAAASDPVAAESAISALGKIANQNSVPALVLTRNKVPAELKSRVDDALLACADCFIREGKPLEAARLFATLNAPSQSTTMRIAALRGIIAARGDSAAQLLVDAIKGADPEISACAIGFTRLLRTSGAVDQIAALLPALPPGRQELLVRTLGEIPVRTQSKIFAKAARNESENVRLAALEALGSQGDGSAAALLAEAAAKGGAEQRVARNSLMALRGEGIDQAILAALSQQPAPVQVELVRALAARKARAAIPDLLQVSRQGSDTVRLAALSALGVLGTEAELSPLAKLALEPAELGDRPAIEEAIAAILRRITDPQKRAAPLLATYATATPAAKPTLLRLLGLAGTADSLAAVRAALNDTAESVRQAAIRTLAEWPDAAPADDLVRLLQTLGDPTQKTLVLRGFVRMAVLAENPTARYARAMELAQTDDEKKLVLAGLGSARSMEALQLAENSLPDAALRAEAAQAIIQLADFARQKDASRAKAALRGVLAAIQEASLRQQAQKVINLIEQHEGYILNWVVVGPFTQKDKESQAIFEFVFPPEDPTKPAIAWQPLTKGMGAWEVTLDTALRSENHCAAYVRTRVWSPAAQEARLELGSDDAVKAWLNGKLVHANYTHRGVGPAQDTAKISLAEGWNELLLKIVNHDGGWGFCCRIRNPDGSALPGLKVDAKAD